MRFYWLEMIMCFCLGFLSVSEVYAGCSVSSTSIIFGNYDVFSSTPAIGNGSITLSCTSKTDVSIAVEASSNSSSFNPRMMQHFSRDDTVNYTLYTSAAMIKVWGDGTQGTATVAAVNVKNNATPIIIYGKIFPLQNVSAGSYSEQLLVTINF